MLMIVGLGNPGKKYEKTRHNMGFDVIDVLCEKLNASLKISRFNARIAKARFEGQELLLVKPYTYMNLSGTAIKGIAKHYKIDTSCELVVIYDDTDLPIGSLRVRKKGSAGGHNGIKSVIGNLGSQEFSRIRVGIGRCPEDMDMLSFVLGRFKGDERKMIDEALGRAAKCALEIARSGIDKAMNMFN